MDNNDNDMAVELPEPDPFMIGDNYVILVTYTDDNPIAKERGVAGKTVEIDVLPGTTYKQIRDTMFTLSRLEGVAKVVAEQR